MAKTTYFTICAQNYLAYALTLEQSFRAVGCEDRFVIFVVDGLEGLDTRIRGSAEFKDAGTLEIRAFDAMCIRYSITELSTAIKPSCFLYLFNQGVDRTVYLDPDILLYRPLEDLDRLFEQGADLILTPHRLSPLDKPGRPSEQDILLTGAYNLGFAAIRRTVDSRNFLAWWRDRLESDCRISPGEGIFVDQKWMDIAPSYLDRVSILRQPGYNVAYWNLDERPLTQGVSGWMAGEEALHFFHFSGVDPTDRLVFSKYQDRFAPGDLGAFQAELDRYLMMLAEHDHPHWSQIPYRFALPVASGRLDPQVRAIVRTEFDLTVRPEDVNPQTLLRICRAPCYSEGVGGLSKLAYELWIGRPDLRRAFDISTKHGRRGYTRWLIERVCEEYRVHPSLFAELDGQIGGLRPLRRMKRALRHAASSVLGRR